MLELPVGGHEATPEGTRIQEYLNSPTMFVSVLWKVRTNDRKPTECSHLWNEKEWYGSKVIFFLYDCPQICVCRNVRGKDGWWFLNKLYMYSCNVKNKSNFIRLCTYASIINKYLIRSGMKVPITSGQNNLRTDWEQRNQVRKHQLW